MKLENVDDEYSTKASAVKDTYTNFFEGVSDVVSVTVEGVWNFIKGLGVAIYEIAEGLISLVIDAGIIAISSKIPDSIEPEFLKKAANTRVETFAGTLKQIIDDPIIVLESVAQSISDTSEKEGIMYVTGGAATSLVPYVGQSKYLNSFSFAFAVKEFLECKGTHYDPVVVDSFMRVIDCNGADILNVKIINK